MKPVQILLGVLSLCILAATGAAASVFVIDPDHSSVSLSATHLGIGTVQGRFDRFSGSFDYLPSDMSHATVDVRIEAASLNTNQTFRDQHLRSDEFLDVTRFPEITFRATRVSLTGSDKLTIIGNLTLHGVSRPVTLDATLRGTSPDMDGKNRIAFSATTQINRQDYGMAWNKTIGANQIVGQTILIFLNIEGVEQAAGGK